MDIKNIVNDVDDNLKSFKSAYQNLLKMRDEIIENISTLESSLAEVEDTLGIASVPNKTSDLSGLKSIKKDSTTDDLPPLMNDSESNSNNSDEKNSEDVEVESDNKDVVDNSDVKDNTDVKASAKKAATPRKSTAKKEPEVAEESDEAEDVNENVAVEEKVDKIKGKEKVQQIIDNVDDDDELLLDVDEDDDDVADDIDELPF